MFKKLSILICLLAIQDTVTCLEAGVVKLGCLKVLWKNWGTKTDFIVSMPIEYIAKESHWFAIGLSQNPLMNDANVVLCKVMLNQSSVEHYINDGYVTRPIDVNNLTLGLSDMRIIKDKSGTMCSFSRENLNTHNSYRIIFEGTEFYFIAAFGDVVEFKNRNFIQYHGPNRYVSSPFTLTNPIIANFVRGSFKNPEFKMGSYKSEFFTIDWIDSAETTDFTFATLNAFNFKEFWSAFAFSKDELMGNDDVNLCKLSKDKPTLEHYHNIIKTTPTLMDIKNRTIGFSNIRATYMNGVLTCFFRREKQLQPVVNYFDLSDEFHILTATGPIIAENLFIHLITNSSSDKMKFLSSEKKTSFKSNDRGVFVTRSNPPPPIRTQFGLVEFFKSTLFKLIGNLKTNLDF